MSPVKYALTYLGGLISLTSVFIDSEKYESNHLVQSGGVSPLPGVSLAGVTLPGVTLPGVTSLSLPPGCQ